MPLFESFERRINQIIPFLEKYQLNSLEDAKNLCSSKGIDIFAVVRGVQPIAFENACWAYTVGAAAAIKKGEKISISFGKGNFEDMDVVQIS